MLPDIVLTTPGDKRRCLLQAFQLHFYEADGTYLGLSSIHHDDCRATRGCLTGLIIAPDHSITGKIARMSPGR